MRINRTPLFGVCLGSLLILAAGGRAADSPDLSRIERRIAKEPSYKGKPLYGLYVFGPEAKTRVWAVLDKSDAVGERYDVLYFDRNADGDLTAADERILEKDGKFAIGELVDRSAKQTHTDVTIRRDEDDDVMLVMNWCGKIEIHGGYAAKAGPYTRFAEKPADAPILWPAADGPLSFQFWQASALAIGDATDVRVFLGHQGHGPNTFCAVPDTFLPKEVPVLATLVYRDENGKAQRARSELRERC